MPASSGKKETKKTKPKPVKSTPKGKTLLDEIKQIRSDRKKC